MHTCTLHSANTRFFFDPQASCTWERDISNAFVDTCATHVPLLKIAAFEMSLLQSIVAFAAFEAFICLDLDLWYANFIKLMPLQHYVTRRRSHFQPSVSIVCQRLFRFLQLN